MNRINGNGDEGDEKTEDGKRQRFESRMEGPESAPKRKTRPKPGSRFDVDGAARYLMDERLEEVITKGAKWWMWNNRIWEPIDPMMVPVREAYDILNKDNKSGKNARAIVDAVNVMRQKTDQEILFRNSIWMDGEAYMINLKNCTLRIEKGQIKCLGHSSRDYATACLPIEYDPKAKCPTFEYLLESCLSDSLDQELLQCFMGYCLQLDHRFQCCLFCHGPRNTGKSLLMLHAFGSVFGNQLMTHVPLDKICAAGDELRELELGLVNLGNEIDHKHLKDSAMFNKVICGEPTNAALKYDKSRLLMPICKYIFIGNHLPRWERGSDAQARRIKILHFGQDFTAQPKDGSLERRVKVEGSGIFNWMLKGLEKVLNLPQMPSGSEQSQERYQEFKKHNNPLEEFLGVASRWNANAYVRADEFDSRFRKWCQSEDVTTFMSGASLFRTLYANYGNRLSADRLVLEKGSRKQVRIIRGIEFLC